jgi:hypothetical protein
MCLCGLFFYSEGVQILSLPIEITLSLWMSLSLNHNHTSLHPKLLFRGRVRLKRIFLTPLPVPTPMLESEQQLTNESPTESTLLVEELRVCSRRKKNKTIPDGTCQTSDPSLGNTTTFDMNYVIPVVNDMSLPIAQHKGVRSCTHHSVSDFVSYQHLSSSYRSFVSKLSSVSVPRNL